MLPQTFLSELSKIFPQDRLFLDPVDCYAYAYDNTRNIFPPDAVVFPINETEIKAVLGLCNEHRVAVTPRGRGTGTAGGSLAVQGGLVLSTEKMREIINIDPANLAIVVQPGVLNQEVQDSIKHHGLFWPPDPSSAAYCSVGGNLATCAGGPHAIKYGVTRDHVLGLRAVTGKGEIIKTGCYTSKSVVGYDLTRLLIGSEGTLAIITEATLKLSPVPQCVGGLTAHYHDAVHCAQAITKIMSQPNIPSAIEFLDHGSIKLVRSRHPNMLPADTHALLIIEVDGSEEEVARGSQAVVAACQNSGLIKAEVVTDTKLLWAARKALSPLLRDIAPKKINEDIVVPVSRLPELLNGLAALSEQYQLNNVNFGHAGNGNIHVNLLIDPNNQAEVQRARACLDEIFDLVIDLNGSISGEHGIGYEKRQFIAKELDTVTLGIMQDLKRVFDPNNVLNPGKLFPT